MTRIPLGMIGGGQGAFIGAVHRIAARLDDRFELVAGALSSTPERARASAEAIGLPRSYDDWAEMARAEAARPDGIRAVAIVTPNHLHFGPARAFLQAGIHVICDKPMTATLAEAEELARIAAQAEAMFFLTHTYSGYPMLRAARRLVAEGVIGSVRVVNVEYVQDWLVDQATGKQAEWRVDPSRSGAGAIGDIGTHAAHLARYVSGLPITQVSADLQSLVAGRAVDDNCHVLLRMGATARGMLWVSQVTPGFENHLRLRLGGSLGGLDWCHDRPDELRLTPVGEPSRILTRGGPQFSGPRRVPAGHPEGFLEAFGTIYTDVAEAILSCVRGTEVPGISDGLDGMRFVTACLRSSADDGRWTGLAS
ncbi:MAG TPA: Gfo/Idh/MocA family oxidoreductase [Paenirhodobacter sp.]